MEIKTIKNIDNETWMEFKALAAKNNMKMSSLFRIMLKEFERNNNAIWEEIINGKKIMNDKEAWEMISITKNFRKELGFRE